MAARNDLVDLEAVAAWPWLADLAGVLREHDRVSRSLRAGHVGLAFFIAARWAIGSGTGLTSLLSDGPLWARLRIAALSGGVDLPVVAPTYDQLKSYRDRVGDGFGDMLEDLLQVLTEAAVAQAQAQGLLLPGMPDFDRLGRGNVLAGDGSVFQAASEARINSAGELVGSRAASRETARIVESRRGKVGDPWGVPVEMVTVRGDAERTRVVVGVEAILDGDETAAAHRAVERIVGVAGGGVKRPGNGGHSSP